MHPLPDTLRPAAKPAQPEPEVVPDVEHDPSGSGDAFPTAVNVPVLGAIAAGNPILAEEHETDVMPLPKQLVGEGNLFMLEVRGDSMIDAGINDGDVVVIRETGTADNGDIVVALVDGAEATLKRYRRRGAMIALEAANPAYETRILPQDKVKVQGRLVGLIRSY